MIMCSYCEEDENAENPLHLASDAVSGQWTYMGSHREQNPLDRHWLDIDPHVGSMKETDRHIIPIDTRVFAIWVAA